MLSSYYCTADTCWLLSWSIVHWGNFHCRYLYRKWGNTLHYRCSMLNCLIRSMISNLMSKRDRWSYLIFRIYQRDNRRYMKFDWDNRLSHWHCDKFGRWNRSYRYCMLHCILNIDCWRWLDIVHLDINHHRYSHSAAGKTDFLHVYRTYNIRPQMGQCTTHSHLHIHGIVLPTYSHNIHQDISLSIYYWGRRSSCYRSKKCNFRHLLSKLRRWNCMAGIGILWMRWTGRLDRWYCRWYFLCACNRWEGYWYHFHRCSNIVIHRHSKSCILRSIFRRYGWLSCRSNHLDKLIDICLIIGRDLFRRQFYYRLGSKCYLFSRFDRICCREDIRS